MTKRLLMAMALAMFASLALAAPSHAGSILTDATLVASSGASDQVNDLTVTYNVPITSGSIFVLPSTTVSVTGTTYTSNSVTITFTSVSAPPTQELDFTLGTASGGPYSAIASEWSGSYTRILASVFVGNASVPEPTSIALLGIGMTGFLAFRRFFKKASVA
jgi:hypothetical protein